MLLTTLCATWLAVASPQVLTVEEAPEWDAVFDRTTGWTGADGIFSIPLAGDDAFGSAATTHTLFVFSDTFIGDVNAQGERLPGTVLVNNTLGLLPAGAGADPAKARFYWGERGGAPQAVFEPNTPNAKPDEFYWLKDGIVVDGVTYLFAGRFSKDPPPFYREGVALITLPRGSRPPFANHVQEEAPLWAEETAHKGPISFGGAILDNTVEGGAPHPDGWVYVYGVREDPLNKRALVARVRRDRIADFPSYRFWDGAAWVPDLADSAPLCGRVSNELSVTPLPDGRYVMVFQLDTIGREVALRIGPSPTGPFREYQTVYVCPVPSQPPVFTYNSKAHPHLSEPGTLLISYNVNAAGPFWDHFLYADIYRPRFVRIRLQ